MLYINQLRFITVYEQVYASILVISLIYVETMSWSYTCWRWQILHFLSVNIKSTLTKIFDYFGLSYHPRVTIPTHWCRALVALSTCCPLLGRGACLSAYMSDQSRYGCRFYLSLLGLSVLTSLALNLTIIFSLSVVPSVKVTVNPNRFWCTKEFYSDLPELNERMGSKP